MEARARTERQRHMMQLLLKMRSNPAECTVVEVFLLQQWLFKQKDINIPATPTCAGDAWLNGVFLWGTREIVAAVEVLIPYEYDPLCAALLGTLISAHRECCLYSVNLPTTEPLAILEYSAEAGCAEGIYRWAITRQHNHADDVYLGLLSKAAKMGHPNAVFELGVWSLDEDDVGQALEYYRQAGDLGNHEAICEEMTIYLTGRNHVPQDIRRAASLCRRLILCGRYESVHHSPLPQWQMTQPQQCTPYGEWCPDPFMHQFVSDNIHHQIWTVLLMNAKWGLPRELVYMICFWICTV